MYTSTKIKVSFSLSKLILTLALHLVLMHKSLAQKEASNWIFGDRAGLRFGSCGTYSLGDNTMYAEEGTASISDTTGKLLFYTNGLTIWNHQNQIIENGKLPLHWTIENSYDSTTISQAALIVEDPGKQNEYYVFLTSPRTGHISDGRFSYVKVDMAANQGAGKVLHEPIQLADSLTERLTAVHHKNGKDVWVITQNYQTAEIYSYLLTKEGIQEVVKSSTDLFFMRTTTRENATGQMKVSPDGTKLALVFWEPSTTYFYNNYICMMSYDTETGIANLPQISIEKLMDEIFYSLEFSPDINQLYVSSNQKVLQYKINTANNTLGDRFVLQDYGDFLPYPQNRRGLQLALDGHIYVTNYSSLDAILYPNLVHKAATFTPFFHTFEGRASAKVALPNFVQSYLVNASLHECTLKLHTYQPCVADTSIISLITPDPEEIDSVIWTSSRPYDAPSFHGFSIRLKFSPFNSTDVSAHVYFKDGSDTTLHTTLKVETLDFQFPSDTTICLGDTLWFDIPESGNYTIEQTNYFGSDIVVTPINGRWTLTQDGFYTLTKHVGNCKLTDRLNLKVVQPPSPIYLGNDTLICKVSYSTSYIGLYTNQPYDVYKNATISWNDVPSNSKNYHVNESGTYWVTIENECGWQSDTITIEFEEAPIVDLGYNRTICEGETITLSVEDLTNDWVWSTGSKEQSITISEAGNYWLEQSNACGTDRHEILVSVDKYIPLELADTIIACVNESVFLDAGQQYDWYKWSTGNNYHIIEVKETGWYEVEVMNSCGLQRARTWVEFIAPENVEIPNVITPNGDGKNDYFILHEVLVGSSLSIYNRWGKQIFFAERYHNQWNGEGLAEGVYWYKIANACLSHTLTGQISILRSSP